MVVRYDAKLVTMFPKGPVVPASVKGSPISCVGETTALEVELTLAMRRVDAERATLLVEGDARRESVLRKVDFRLMG